MSATATNRQVFCQSCDTPFISLETHEEILVLAREKGLVGLEASFGYCPKCRSHFFARELIGDRLEKKEKPKQSASRRKDEVRSIRHDDRLDTTVYKTQCYICNQGCDATVHVKNGEVVLVEGDRSSAVTMGTLCSKGLASREILYHPDRLLYPMKRTGARGEGRWQRITWDEALDTIAQRLRSIEKEFGEESIVLATGPLFHEVYQRLRQTVDWSRHCPVLLPSHDR
jgi:Zn-finger nucleic acid-binding protein